MDTPLELPGLQIPVKIGPIEFQYALSDALIDQKESRVEALASWLCAEWQRKQEEEARS